MGGRDSQFWDNVKDRLGINDFYQIVQTPTHVMILAEMVHDVRIVRMNATHLPSNIRQWLGDSIVTKPRTIEYPFVATSKPARKSAGAK